MITATQFFFAIFRFVEFPYNLKIDFGCFEILRISAQVQSRVDEVHSRGKCIRWIIFYQNMLISFLIMLQVI